MIERRKSESRPLGETSISFLYDELGDIDMSEIYLWVINEFQTNDVFSGLVSATLMASLMYTARRTPGKIWEAIHYFMVSYVKISNDQSVYAAINHWLSGLDYAKKSRRLRIYEDTVREGEEKDSKFVTSLAEGRHFFFYDGRPIVVVKTSEDTNGAGGQTLARKETITIYAFGATNRFIFDIIVKAMNNFFDGDKMRVFQARYGWWGNSPMRKLKRPIDSVVMPTGELEKIIDDISEFRTAEDWYSSNGIPYHRGYLFSGPPGTGKTSLVLALASHFDLPIYMIQADSVSGDSDLASLISKVTRGSIILIEDIDVCMPTHARAVVKKEADEAGSCDTVEEKDNKITMSGLLNVLDGLSSPEGSIIVMTTNHPEELDPAIIRPGRVDTHIKFTGIDRAMAKSFFSRFYPEYVGKAVEKKFVKAIIDHDISPAAIQGLCIRYKNEDPSQVVKSILSDNLQGV